ncbi:cupredoxin domain-containing protein [candidate division KSB1 bacterium]|nr:cupredoxin domain-containing protein [candidate division KSB1 bacterium]
MILIFLFFRKRNNKSDQNTPIQRVEVKLSGTFHPAETRIQVNRPTQLLIHRFETEPEHELFEIEELNLYELLPAKHTTIIAFTAEKRGSFGMVVAGEREAGRLIVE